MTLGFLRGLRKRVLTSIMYRVVLALLGIVLSGGTLFVITTER